MSHRSASPCTASTCDSEAVHDLELRDGLDDTGFVIGRIKPMALAFYGMLEGGQIDDTIAVTGNSSIAGKRPLPARKDARWYCRCA
jgi:hypothetical protein